MKKLDEKYIRKYIENKGGILTNTWNYINSRTKFLITCRKGHKWKVTWNSLQNMKSWCPKCYQSRKNTKKEEKDIKKFIIYKGGVLDKDFNYINSWSKFNITCHKGHKWKATWANIQQGHWCPKCGIIISKIKQRNNGEKIRKYIENKGGKLNKNWEYKNAFTGFNIRCNKNHTWKTRWNTIQQGHWCPICSTPYKENDFRCVIEKIFNKPFPRKRPKWLRDPKTNSPLELDGYNKELKVAFEYQGEQHYEGGWHSKSIIKKDAFKVKQCKEKEILLIIVPYWIPKSKWNEGIKRKYKNFKRSKCEH